MFDILIKNGTIYDGTGSAGYIGDIAVKDGKIAAMGEKLEDEAKRVIDASGLRVTPGFIDSHSHGDDGVFDIPTSDNIVLMGTTTIISGQCGTSEAPCVDPKRVHYEKRKTVKTWFDAIDEQGQGCNVVLLAGHGTIRNIVMGELANRDPSPEEMEQMKAMLAKCMDEGAKGINMGIYYAPGVYAKTPEIIELAKVVAEKGGVVSCHIRSESIRLIQSVQEMIDVARESGATVIISHHKAAGGPNYWGLTEKTTAMIEQARAEGINIYCDVYPFEACSTSLWSTYIDPQIQALGKPAVKEKLNDPAFRAQCRDWIEETFIRHSWHEKGLSWCMMCGLDKYTEYNGLRINEAAKIHGKDEFETLFDVLQANDMNGRGVLFTMNEEDVKRVISKPYAMIGSDGGTSNNPVHPRLYATFSRALNRFVKQLEVVPFEEMIRKMTSLAAQVYSLDSKGVLAVGKDADICVLDWENLRETATFAQPKLPNIGYKYVLVNGEIAVENDQCLKTLSGTSLRR